MSDEPRQECERCGVEGWCHLCPRCGEWLCEGCAPGGVGVICLACELGDEDGP